MWGFTQERGLLCQNRFETRKSSFSSSPYPSYYAGKINKPRFAIILWKIYSISTIEYTFVSANSEFPW